MKNLQLFAFLKFPRECFRTAVIEIKQLKKLALTLTLNKKGYHLSVYIMRIFVREFLDENFPDK
jgi:hypothetical protein